MILYKNIFASPVFTILFSDKLLIFLIKKNKKFYNSKQFFLLQVNYR